jgi:adenylosuccinate lyase
VLDQYLANNFKMALSPLANRYRSVVQELEDVFSDKQYFLARLRIELTYLAILTKHKGYYSDDVDREYSWAMNCEDKDSLYYNEFCEIDKITQHDVKALEYFVKSRILREGSNWVEIRNLVHCGLTSQDVNSLGYTWMLSNSLKYLKSEFDEFASIVNTFLSKMDTVAMGYTHGQPAIPVNIGEEYRKHFRKITTTFKRIQEVQLTAKFASSTGNYSTLLVIFANMEEIHKMQAELLKMLGVDFQLTSHPRQIDDYTSYVVLLQLIQQLALNLKEFALNVWLRITRGELVQIKKDGEVGSSVMSHKINPWRLEQAEATSNIIHGLCDAVIRTISVSRDSRDMSDSYALRYMGEILGNVILLLRSIANDIGRLETNKQLITASLEANWGSLSEYIQTYLRWNCPMIEDPYKLLADFTKGKKITQAELLEFIASLPIEDHHKKKLSTIEINHYVGIYH